MEQPHRGVSEMGDGEDIALTQYLPPFKLLILERFLSELDINKMDYNLELRHDINFDPDLQHDINFDPDLHLGPKADNEIEIIGVSLMSDCNAQQILTQNSLKDLGTLGILRPEAIAKQESKATDLIPAQSTTHTTSIQEDGAREAEESKHLQTVNSLPDCCLDKSVQEQLQMKWILNLSMHFRDKSNREKFFATYAETPTQWRQITISLDYGKAVPGSLEDELQESQFQHDKSERIYAAIRKSVPEIQFYDTVTNLKPWTKDGILQVHVTEDILYMSMSSPARTMEAQSADTKNNLQASCCSLVSNSSTTGDAVRHYNSDISDLISRSCLIALDSMKKHVLGPALGRDELESNKNAKICKGIGNGPGFSFLGAFKTVKPQPSFAREPEISQGTRRGRKHPFEAVASNVQLSRSLGPGLDSRNKYDSQESDKTSSSKHKHTEEEKKEALKMAPEFSNYEVEEGSESLAPSDSGYRNREQEYTSDSASLSQYNEEESGPLGRRLGKCPLVLLDSSGDSQAVNGTIDTGSCSSFISERAVIDHGLLQEPLRELDIKSFHTLISNSMATPTTFVRVWIKGKKAGLDQFTKVHLRVLRVPDTSDVDIVIGMPLIEKFDVLSKIQRFPTFAESKNPLFAIRFTRSDAQKAQDFSTKEEGREQANELDKVRRDGASSGKSDSTRADTEEKLSDESSDTSGKDSSNTSRDNEDTGK